MFIDCLSNYGTKDILEYEFWVQDVLKYKVCRVDWECFFVSPSQHASFKTRPRSPPPKRPPGPSARSAAQMSVRSAAQTSARSAARTV